MKGHPYIERAETKLRIARERAEEVPFPYAKDTAVILRTPVGSSFFGAVERCDEWDGWLVIRALDAPDSWTDNPLVYHALTAPEEITVEGALVFDTRYRANGAKDSPDA